MSDDLLTAAGAHHVPHMFLVRVCTPQVIDAYALRCEIERGEGALFLLRKKLAEDERLLEEAVPRFNGLQAYVSMFGREKISSPRRAASCDERDEGGDGTTEDAESSQQQQHPGTVNEGAEDEDEQQDDRSETSHDSDLDEGVVVT
jgi:hypothetical protein